MESLSSKNKNVKYCKPNKLWVDQGREFHNKLTQELLDINDILVYSAHNENS